MTRRVGPAEGEFGRLTSLVVKSPREAFGSGRAIAREWRDLHFTAAPIFEPALAEHERLLDLIVSSGCEVLSLPAADGTGLDSIYTRDASIVAPKGVVLGRMGKSPRAEEPAAQGRGCESWRV